MGFSEIGQNVRAGCCLHADGLEQIVSALLGWAWGGDDVERRLVGGCTRAATCVADNGAQILEQGLKAVDRRAVIEDL